MKVRCGFVTNSSSSSFIIARRIDCTHEDIVALLNEKRKIIENFIEENKDYCYDLEDGKTVEEYIEFLAKEFMRETSGRNVQIELDQWKITALEGGSDDGEGIGFFLYVGTSDFNGSKFKIGG